MKSGNFFSFCYLTFVRAILTLGIAAAFASPALCQLITDADWSAIDGW